MKGVVEHEEAEEGEGGKLELDTSEAYEEYRDEEPNKQKMKEELIL